MYPLLYTNCCTIWNLEEYQLFLTVIILSYLASRYYIIATGKSILYSAKFHKILQNASNKKI